MWMIQRRNRAGLALKAGFQLSAGRKMSRQNLDRYSAVEPRVAGAVDLAHPARSERSNDFVRPEFGARCEDHRCAIIGLLDPNLPVIPQKSSLLHRPSLDYSRSL